MRIAIVSDECHPIHNAAVDWLNVRGLEFQVFGAIAEKREVPWADAAEAAARAVASGTCDEGLFFCWTGTGICMAANKVAGIRAALVWDAGGAAGARVWNHANVLCLSNRFCSEGMLKEILNSWFSTEMGEKGREGVDRMNALDRRHRGK
ncbi:MAG: RpiB/LacA/LacB family sugar-phosphate isomerase [Deltaproteobacteria bacterium]|nr:RpiB/LacA/LacB family sugar-phosphate isomerase [Deltaproteobacteria bacterium]